MAKNKNGQAQEKEGSEVFESTSEKMTSFKSKPPWFDRKKVIFILAGIFVAIVLMGTVFGGGGGRQRATEAPSGFAANPPRDFLRNELERSIRAEDELFRQREESIPVDEFGRQTDESLPPVTDEYGMPVVTSIPPGGRPPAWQQEPPVQFQQYQAPPQSNERQPQPQLSSLIPFVEGRIRNGSTVSNQGQAQNQAVQDQGIGMMPGMPPGFDIASMMPDFDSIFASIAGLDAAQNAQNGSLNSSSAISYGAAITGHFLQDNVLWIGTVIPAVLVTAINTDLPGNVLARVTQNIYDSRTGSRLLIPQGTLLFAQYNNSVSYQQKRVQIVWDILIRPDGFMIELEGMNGVDRRGMAGLKARYRENWFEYVKAAGIIAVFSIANASLVEQVAQYGSDEMVAAAIAGNAAFIENIGGSFISRAMNIQPTLTVESGERISIMINKNIGLPPVEAPSITQRYTLPRAGGR